MNLLTRFILRRAPWVIALGTLFTVWAGHFSVLLYQNLRTDLEELLPTTARSVLDMNEVTRRLESIDNLAILVFSNHPQESKRFVTDLAAKLAQAPKDTIASVEYRIDRELKFFTDRRPLYMESSDLIQVRNYIRDRIDYERALYNPLNIFSEQEIPEPQLDFDALKNKYEKKVSAYSRFPDGYYATPDEKKRAILVYMPGKFSGTAAIHRLKDYVIDSINELKPASYAPDITIHYTGGVQNTIEEHAALIKDLGVSSLIVILVVTAALFIFFRALLPTLALILSLLMGTLWTFGIAYFAVGYLNANSAFLGSIIIGNGINFGIIFLARYLEERRRLRGNLRSIHRAMTHTAKATWTAALAAGLSYGSLTLTGFRGFNQFGVIGLIGMVLCWISAFTLLPAFLCLFERLRPISIHNIKAPKARFSTAVAGLVNRRPALLWALSFVATVASLAMFINYTPEIIETDLDKLRNKTSMEKGSGYLSIHIDEIFQRYLSPIVILPKNRNSTVEIAEKLKEIQKKEGKASLISSVQTMDDFVPSQQPEKIRVLQEIRKLLSPRLLHRLSPEDQKLVSEFLTPQAFRPVQVTDLPALVVSKFTEKDGSLGKLVLVEPPLDPSLKKGEKLIRFIHQLRETSDSVEPATPVAGTLPITSDMIEAIVRDGPRATLFSFLAVVLLVVFLFRHLKTISLILFALILGVLWFAGLILGLGLKINFLNFIALPITFGIGVDYGVNIFQRFRQEQKENILRVIRNTGGAVGLCSFTTITGYSSLLLAENQAFVSFGTLAVLGEITCLLAAVIALPAFLIFQERRQERRQERQKEKR